MVFQRLQSIQNAAARLVTGITRSEHIQPVLRRLHWLPVRQCASELTSSWPLTYQALHGLLPSYLSEDYRLTADTGRRQLRSSNTNICFVPRSHSSFGDFSVAGPTLWNSLPASIQSFDNGCTTFKRLLKTYLF